MDNLGISGLVSQTLAEVTRQLCRKRGIRKCIILGGDTFAAFCRMMEIRGMEVLEEIESGIPLLKKPIRNSILF